MHLPCACWHLLHNVIPEEGGNHQGKNALPAKSRKLQLVHQTRISRSHTPLSLRDTHLSPPTSLFPTRASSSLSHYAPRRCSLFCRCRVAGLHSSLLHPSASSPLITSFCHPPFILCMFDITRLLFLSPSFFCFCLVLANARPNIHTYNN